MFSNQSGSRRWTHFHSALQLAIQRSAHKWTFEDFAECFPLYVESDKNGSSATFNSISEYIEAQNFRDLDKLFKDYKMRENIDTLHKVVNDAKERKLKDDAEKDTWKGDLDPKVAVCARTVPVLKSEAARLRAMISQLEEENQELESELQSKVDGTNNANEQVLEILDNLDAVFQSWRDLPHEEIEAWTVQTAESLKPTLQS
ncbi:hypothetical protein GALMADRAFT_240879 [Galerina marginata CBS 339.88]|uniref:Uncharacterized protein n=1 Tax=Galerina marginata (strain CBS 339.88) TaxID=685588 RepID=A0A067TBQ6_GALM3|nr:hypothetical protein GALMADRAFT_240879 [Galerina marginata CBS 339.88]